MELYFIEMFGVSLFLTIIIEMAVLFLLREHSVKNIILLIWVNVLTNPAAVLCVWLISIHTGVSGNIWVQIPIEILVIVVESAVYLIFSKETDRIIKRPIMLAVTANLTSWLFGFFIQYF